MRTLLRSQNAGPSSKVPRFRYTNEINKINIRTAIGFRCVRYSERFTNKNVYTDGGQIRRCPVPCLLNNPDCDFSASQSADDIGADIPENLFASLIVRYCQLLDDLQVQFRIGEIIAQAMSQPTRPSRR